MKRLIIVLAVALALVAHAAPAAAANGWNLTLKQKDCNYIQFTLKNNTGHTLHLDSQNFYALDGLIAGHMRSPRDPTCAHNTDFYPFLPFSPHTPLLSFTRA